MVSTQEHAEVGETNAPSLQKWHCRFGHINYSYLNMMVKEKVVNGLKYFDDKLSTKCEDCAQGKMHRLSFLENSVNKTSRPHQFIHSDLCRPMSVDSIGESKYVLTFMGELTGNGKVYILSNV